MSNGANFEPSSRQLDRNQLRVLIDDFFPKNATTTQKITAVEAALTSPAGQFIREALAHWIVDELLPADHLVPASYQKWRAPVRDSMMFVVVRLSAARLAPKLVEQLELPEDSSPEERLLRLIAKVPGLQKLGQVIARNQHLRPALRKALARLENGIRDMKAEEVAAITEKELGPRLKKYDVKIAAGILSEASVSAVVRFTWRCPETGSRERGVFKVLKPHIPGYFAEDMQYLQGLAQHFGDRHHSYGFPSHLIPDTFRKVRRLLQHEVNFRREQKTLVEAGIQYRGIRGVHVPRLIRPLCTKTITALTEERGLKVTKAALRLPTADRRRIAEQLIEALIAVPLFSGQENAIFHGDPHAGNLLYDRRTRQLTVIDWALRERLSREQRRHLALLVLMVGLRDPLGTANEVRALSEKPIHPGSGLERAVGETVVRFFGELTIGYLPSAGDAMRLLERAALQGLRFPSPLVMLSKVVFMLDGLLADITGGSAGGMSPGIARHLVQHWIAHRSGFRSPLKAEDWIILNCSALLYPTRSWLIYEEKLMQRYLPAPTGATGA